MKTSPAGIALIQSFESCRLRAYQDSVGIWTIGWGHTHAVREHDTCTQAEADELLQLDLGVAEDGVNALVKVDLLQCEFDALVSFAYNVGLDMDTDEVAEGLGDSTLLRKLNVGDLFGAANEFPKWNKAGGGVLAGLIRRRAAERALFMGV